ncbi:hypothetical protein H4S08_000279 [Coemansia sp. RSA 1365]|nr:hypothetical protein H4S08_000279 [Coemansia sp. RSA 1365]
MNVIDKQLQNHRDKRIKIIKEAISGIKAIKLYAWDMSFVERIRKVRNILELVALRKYGLLQALLLFVSTFNLFIVSFSTFALYVLADNTSRGPLTSQLIFVALMLFNMLEGPLKGLAKVIPSFQNATVSYRRLQKFMIADEIDLISINRAPYNRAMDNTSTSDELVNIANGTFKWLPNDKPALENINFQCKRSELVAVIGQVGCGKSSLVSAILGDLIKQSGSATVCGRIAYVPQHPWILNATLRDNILFGSCYDEEFYNQVIDACALRPDIDILPSGDKTEIGENGINLSGGQNMRVSLARAVYARADLYVLDDPLAAVDSHVSKHIFTNVLGPQGLLQSRARILVTNAVQYMHSVDNIVLLSNGNIVEQMTFDQAMATKGAIYEFIHKYIGNEEFIESKRHSSKTSTDNYNKSVRKSIGYADPAAIIGRTGAGKSSLTLALFRIIEAASGQILLDGEDISQYGLFDVRSKMSVIPQDPMLFAGTVRDNLDPFNIYSDQDIWHALEQTHLADYIRSKDERLEFIVAQGGENFSGGQKQLICLARALLKHSKVLVLDEATAAIDNATDETIQQTIRTAFKDCTVLTVAHRINTVIDSDMVLVIDGGRLAEYDAPQKLIANKNSLFAKFVEEAQNSST